MEEVAIPCTISSPGDLRDNLVQAHIDDWASILTSQNTIKNLDKIVKNWQLLLVHLGDTLPLTKTISITNIIKQFAEVVGHSCGLKTVLVSASEIKHFSGSRKEYAPHHRYNNIENFHRDPRLQADQRLQQLGGKSEQEQRKQRNVRQFRHQCRSVASCQPATIGIDSELSSNSHNVQQYHSSDRNGCTLATDDFRNTKTSHPMDHFQCDSTRRKSDTKPKGNDKRTITRQLERNKTRKNKMPTTSSAKVVKQASLSTSNPNLETDDVAAYYGSFNGIGKYHPST